MTQSDQRLTQSTVVMTAEAMAAAIRRMAAEICDSLEPKDSLVLLGILSRGRPLADRIAGEIESKTGAAPKVGSLATTLYRDDLRSGMGKPKVGTGETHFDFDVSGVTAVLVDDVISAGRTVRAAMDEVMDYGRPRRIQLACLVDRGLRELPIQPDYLGVAVDTHPDDHVAVRLAETDGEDLVVLERDVEQNV